MPIDFTSPHTAVYARDPASKEFLLDGALEGHVLVKNVNKSLPLNKPKVLSIFGYDARAPSALDVPLPTDRFGAFASGYE
jgi:beta-glucosidase